MHQEHFQKLANKSVLVTGGASFNLASIDEAKSLLGYDPKFKIEEGLKAAVEWYYNNL